MDRESGMGRRRAHRGVGAVLLAILLGGARSAAAQGRIGGGAALTIAVPQGEFADFVGAGFGVMGDLTFALDGEGWLGIRLDGGYLNYGRETERAPLSPTVGRVNVDVTTGNNIILAALGPQLTLPHGPFRPYVNAIGGLSYFFTESSVKGTANVGTFARTTNFSDLTYALGVGGGVYIPLGGGVSPVLLDLGLQYRTHGRTRYLREGSIRDDGTGGISFTPIESDTDLLLIRLGLSFGFR